MTLWSELYKEKTKERIVKESYEFIAILISKYSATFNRDEIRRIIAETIRNYDNK